MTLKQLEAFYFAATLGNFALAAQRVHVTQSSLSKRIAELEVWAGAALFDRSGNRAKLTEAGHKLMPVAAQMLDLKDRARGALDNTPNLTGVCRFGISELGSLTWLPKFISRVRSDHPHLVMQPHVDLGRRLERQVTRGELDFAIIPGPAEDVQLSSWVVGDVSFAWMAAPGRVPRDRVLTAGDLSRHPVITMTDGSGLTQAFNVWAAAQGLKMQRIVASNSLMAIIGLTIADVGLSFLPRDFVAPWVERGALVELQSVPELPMLKYCFVHREDDRREQIRVLSGLVTDVVDFDVPAV